MEYKSGQIFLPFCQNPRVRRTNRRTDRQTDGQLSHRAVKIKRLSVYKLMELACRRVNVGIIFLQLVRANCNYCVTYSMENMSVRNFRPRFRSCCKWSKLIDMERYLGDGVSGGSSRRQMIGLAEFLCPIRMGTQ